jgi:integrase
VTRAQVVRGVSARRSRAGSNMARLAEPASVSAPPVRPVLPEEFTDRMGNVVVVVHSPSQERVKGAVATRNMLWRVRPRAVTGLTDSTRRTQAAARAEALRIVAAHDEETGGRPFRKVSAAAAEYLRVRSAEAAAGGAAPVRHPRKGGRHRLDPWVPSYSKASGRRLATFVAKFGDRKCAELTAHQVSDFIASQPTPNAEEEMLKTVKAFTRWMLRQGWMLTGQAVCERLAVYELKRPQSAGRLGVADPGREQVQGRSAWFVGDREVPTHAKVHAAASNMACVVQRGQHRGRAMDYLELMFLIAAYVGLRLSEVLALTCDDVVEAGRVKKDLPPHELVIDVSKQRGSVPGVSNAVRATKNRRKRVCMVPMVTPKRKWPLTVRLRARAEQARAEREGGTNPDGLLFPCTDGIHMWGLSNLRQRVFYPAIEAAGWPTVTKQEQESLQSLEARRRALRAPRADAEEDNGLDGAGDRVSMEGSRFLWTFHSLRHTAARYWVFQVRDRSGGPLPLTTVSMNLGHSSTWVTDHVYVGDQRRG